MQPQVSQQIEQSLRQQWQTLCPQILERFTTVSKADLDAARSADDLVRRVADRTHYSERYVETQITELVLAGGGQQAAQQYSQGAQQSAQQFQPFGGQSSQSTQSQPFGASQQGSQQPQSQQSQQS